MTKKGLTLIELVITMVISSLIALALMIFFVAEYRFRVADREKIALIREANIAMHHMTRILRFARAGTIDDGIDAGVGVLDRIGDITNGDGIEIMDNVTPIPAGGAVVEYVRTAGNVFQYTQDAGPPVDVATNITGLSTDWNDPDLTINLAASDGNNAVNLQTSVRVLGD